jgi:hypothetical protein
VAANPASVSAGGLSIITAKVQTSNTEAAVSGVAVTFSVNGAGGAETVSPATAVTDRNGNATTVFIGNSGAAAGSANAVKASMTAGGNTYTAAVVIPYP